MASPVEEEAALVLLKLDCPGYFYPFHFHQCRGEEVEQMAEGEVREVEEVEGERQPVPLVGDQEVVGAKEAVAMKCSFLSRALGA